MEPSYTSEETDQHQQVFAPVAKLYRRHMRIMYAGVIGFMCWILLLILVLKPSAPGWGQIVPALICWIIAPVAFVSAPELICPGCRKRLDKSLGRYCPECGCNRFEAGNWYREHCPTCGRRLSRYKGRRHYKIRACTHCGLMLDKKGV
jgi:hypothetical protein